MNKFNEILEKEKANNKEICLWMSFRNPKKNKFLGVIIIKSLGLTHATIKTHELGINPGGEIQSIEIEEELLKPEHFDILLTKNQLIEYGYIKRNN